ncbi:divalent metal cation transporter [Raineyella fluvialis]|uniref:Divalent metal cation transporter n=2 Tax=Raineyella fluvialis TaxID=2662261 RepID=A0A5Q2FK78_9ACTN|nr:divalent metal cation transporter [Raineyella fluvialis]
MAMSATALGAVVGPGLIAGLSDDDPAGITTYSSLGASYGYELLWVLVVSTIALILFQDLGARIGVVTGQGLAGLIRQRYGARAGVLSIAALVVANIGTTTAEFAGIAAGTEIFGVSRYISVPIAAIAVSMLVLRGGFRGVERVLIVLSAVFLAYVGAGFLSGPDWGAAVQGMVVPRMPLTRDAVLIITATFGTTLAPWGLAFIQSYAVDKKLGTKELGLLRIDVVTGAILTGVIGFFVVVATAATMHAHGIEITDAASAAVALQPLAGPLAEMLFAVGLLGAALLAASILPLSTAYSVCDVAGRPAALDDSPREAPLFYGTFAAVTVVGVVLVLLPGVSLVPILVLTQVLNAVLLLPLLAYMAGIARDSRLMGTYVAGRAVTSVYYIVIALVVVCIAAMLWLTFFGQ